MFTEVRWHEFLYSLNYENRFCYWLTYIRIYVNNIGATAALMKRSRLHWQDQCSIHNRINLGNNFFLLDLILCWVFWVVPEHLTQNQHWNLTTRVIISTSNYFYAQSTGNSLIWYQLIGDSLVYSNIFFTVLDIVRRSSLGLTISKTPFRWSDDVRKATGDGFDKPGTGRIVAVAKVQTILKARPEV